MKLIAYDSLSEGQILRSDAYIACGKLADYKGWYLLFNLRFITKHVNGYIDPDTWKERPAQCYYRAIFKLRYRTKDNKWLFGKSSARAEL